MLTEGQISGGLMLSSQTTLEFCSWDLKNEEFKISSHPTEMLADFHELDLIPSFQTSSWVYF